MFHNRTNCHFGFTKVFKNRAQDNEMFTLFKK